MMNRDELYYLLMKLLWCSSPHPHEREVLEQHLPKGGEWDKFGNYIVTVAGESKTLFACHMDTVGMDKEITNPTYHEGFLYVGNLKDADCLGGDDRCGILCLIALIKAGIPGTYIFHAGEERGCIGASYLVDHFDFTPYKRAIEFDRRGETSIITKMGGSVTCSDAFANSLAEQLGMGYKPDPTGLFTDVGRYCDMVPECTNLSVGYQNEHGSREIINAAWLVNQFIPALYEVKWEELPVSRDPKKDSYNFRGTSSTMCTRHRGRYWSENDDNFNSWNPQSSQNYSGNSFNSAGIPIGPNNPNNGTHKRLDNKSNLLPLSGLNNFTCDFCFCGGTLVKRNIDGNTYSICETCSLYLDENELEIAQLWDEEKVGPEDLASALPESEEPTLPGIGTAKAEEVKTSIDSIETLTEADIAEAYLGDVHRFD